jgi:tRNA (adenine37-N6)-methyltransferase
MVRENEINAGEAAIEWPGADDDSRVFIGRIHKPWTNRMDCPRQGRDGPICRIEVFEPWAQALAGIEYDSIEVLYWLHRSLCDILLQSPRSDGTTRGAFSLRPNPIGDAARDAGRSRRTGAVSPRARLSRRTPLIDIKPDRYQFTANTW